MDDPMTAGQDEAASWQYSPTNSPVDTAIQDAANPNVSPDQSAASEEAAITYDPAQAKADAQAKAQQDKAQQAAYRISAQDLTRRGIGYYTDLNTGAPTTANDETGAPLTNFDKSTGVGYDSTGNARKLAFNTQTGAAELQDPYEGAQKVTDKQGNIYTAPKGLPWRFEGTNPDIQQKNQETAQAKLEQQTATALAGPVAMAKSRFIQTQQAVDASEKSTAATLQKLGVAMTAPDGSPVDLTNTGPDQLRAMVKGSYDAETAAPEANEKQFFGSGLSQSAQTLRQDIANRQKQAQDALDGHIGVVSAMQKAGSDYDQARAPLAAISVAKLTRLNENRVAAGLQPVQIPDELKRVAQIAAPPIPGMDHAGELTPQSPGAQPAAAPATPGAQPSPAPGIPGLQSEGALQSFLRPLESNIVPAAGTAVGGALGGLGAGALGLPSGPGAVATAIAGDIAGGIAGGALAQKAQNAIMGGEWTAQNQAQMAANAKQHPIASALGNALPMLLSMIGGGGAKPIKSAGQGLEKAAQGLLSRTVSATEGDPGLLTKAMTALAGHTAQLPTIMTQGARVGGAAAAQQDVNEKKDFSNILPEAIKGAVTFGPTAFVPAATTIMGSAAKGLGMAGVMEVSNALYDHFVEGKPISAEDIKNRLGTSGPAFAIQEVLMGMLHGAPAKLPEGGEPAPGAEGAKPAPEHPAPAPATPVEAPAAPSRQAELERKEQDDITAANQNEADKAAGGKGDVATRNPLTDAERAELDQLRGTKEAAPAKIVGPALLHKTLGLVAEGTEGQQHKDLIPQAVDTVASHPDPEASGDMTFQHVFKDSNGTVLNRQEAWDTAKQAGQIDPDTLATKEAEAAKTGVRPELHTQDLISPSPSVETPVNQGEAVTPNAATESKPAEVGETAKSAGGGETIPGLEPKAAYEEAKNEKHPEPTPEQKAEVEKHLATPEAKEVIARMNKLRGVKLTDEETGRSLETSSEGTTINRRALANHLSRLDSDEAKQHYVVRGLDEELKHQATLIAFHGKPEELEAIGKGLTDEERSAVESNYGAKMSDYAAGAEAIRTFMQATEGRGTTEAHKLLTEKAKTDSTFRQAVQKVLDLVKKIAGNKGAMSERLREGIDKTQAVLDGLEKKPEEPAQSKVRIGNSPQLHTVVEELPRQQGDLPDERFFNVKNDRTGETQVVESKDMTPVKARSEEQKAVAAEASKATNEALDKRLREAGLDPSALPDVKSKRAALKRKEALGASVTGLEEEGKIPGLESLGASTPEERKPEGIPGLSEPPKEETPKLPEGKATSEPQQLRGSASTEDKGETTQSPAQKLTDQADRMGISYSLETLKKLIRGDAATAESMRARIRDKGEEPLGAASIQKIKDTIARHTPGLDLIKNSVEGIKSLLLPSSLSPEHLEEAEMLRTRMGEAHRRQEADITANEVPMKAFDKAGAGNDKIPLTDNIGMKAMSDMSQGRPLAPHLAGFDKQVKAQFDHRLDLLDKAGVPLDQVRQNYFPGMWTTESRNAFNRAFDEAKQAGKIPANFDINNASPQIKADIKARVDQLLQSGDPGEQKHDAVSYLAKRPMEGKGSFRKAKVFDDVMTAAEMGLRPVFTNPVEMANIKLAEMDKFILAHQHFDDLEKAGKLINVKPNGEPMKKGFALPAGFDRGAWAKLPDRYGDIMMRDPDTGMLTKMGERWVTKPVHDVLSNYLSSSLYNNRYFGDMYKAWMGMANLLNQSQLGVGSAFHAGFTAMEAQTNGVAQVLKDIFGVMRGNRSAKQLGESVKQMITAVPETVMTGDKVLNAYRNPTATVDPMIAKVARAVELAGGAFKMERGLATEQAHLAYRDWFGGNKLRAIARSPVAAIEKMSQLIAGVLVPRQKAGIFAHMAERIIEQNPGKSLEELAPQFQKTWNYVDAALGQVVYSRLFANNTAKNVVQGLVRAPGWSGGTIAQLFGGMKDAAGFVKEWQKTGKMPADIPPRTAYTMALVLTGAVLNGAMTYAFTGQMPSGTDYMAFRTGKKDENGNDERFMLPSYLKDMWAYSQHPGQTLLNKSHPLTSMVSQLAQNKDYYGTEIRNPDAGPAMQAEQGGKFVLQQFEPFWIRGMQKEQERRSGTMEKIAPLFGVTPAPKEMNQTKAEKLASEISHQRMPALPATEQQAARRVERSRATIALRQGDPSVMQNDLRAGKLQPRDVRSIQTKATTDPLVYQVKSLPLEQAERVYKIANSQEKAKLQPIMAQKRTRAGTPYQFR